MLHDDAFEDVGDVLALVSGLLELVEKLFPLHDGDGIALLREQLLDGMQVHPVRFVLEPVDLDDVRGDGDLLFERLDGRQHGLAGGRQQLRELARAGPDRRELVQGHERRAVVDRVHAVVERAGQLEDVFAVERGDERLVEALDRRVRQRVAAVLDLLDLVRQVVARGIGGNHLLEQRGPLGDLLGHGREVVVELLFFGNQSERHKSPVGATKPRDSTSKRHTAVTSLLHACHIRSPGAGAADRPWFYAAEIRATQARNAAPVV